MKKTRIIAGITALCLTCGITVIPEKISPVVPETATAESVAEISWTLSDGVLTISGTGDMPDYKTESYIMEYPEDDIRTTAPWSQDCLSITEVIIEDGITSIGNWAFYNCFNVKKVTMPESITKIGDMAFYRCRSIDTIKIPDKVTSIGSHAFSGCSSIPEIVIPDGVTVIEEQTFHNCDSLASITIPDSVTTIGYDAMSGCNALTSVNISEYVTDLESSALSGNQSLTDINISADNPNYSSEDGVIFDKDKTILLMYSRGKQNTSYNIPDTVNTIGDHSFNGNQTIEEITMSDNVTTIGNFAFRCCRNLKSLQLSGNLETTGEYAFSECSALESVDIPASLVNFGQGTFHYSGLKSVTIPEGITIIPRNAFTACNLTSVNIPSTVTEIGEGAFSGCKIDEVTVPENVTLIGMYALDDCKKITVLNPECSIYQIFGKSTKSNRQNGIIYGYYNSKVKSYASSNEYNFIAIDKDFTTLVGDVNFDAQLTIADSVAIMQAMINPDSYKLKRQNRWNADVVDRGDGLTTKDAVAIQMVLANIITYEDLPITSEEIENLSK